jgi:inositol transport system substrate-binding protein
MQRLQSCLVSVLFVLLFQSHAFAEVRIGVAIAELDNFVATFRDALEAKSKTLPGVTLQFQDARGDVVTQINQVQSFINQHVDALIVLPIDVASTRTITKAVTAAKIPLVYANRVPTERPLPASVAVVASEHYTSGVLQMEYLAEKLGGKGNLAIVMGDLANGAATDRTRGVLDVAKRYPEIKVVEKQTAAWKRDVALDLVSSWVLAGREFDAIASNNDEMAIGAAMALRQAGKKNVLIGGTDGTRDGLAAVASGMLTVSVLQDAQGQAGGAIDAALKLIKHEPVDPQFVVVPYRLITPNNVKEFQSTHQPRSPQATP